MCRCCQSLACRPYPASLPAMLASRHQSSSDAGSQGRLFSSSYEEQPAFSGNRRPSRSRHHCGKDVVVLPVVVPEGELVEIERQVRLRDMMEVPHDAPLDERPEAVNVARVDLAADVLSGAMVDRLVGPLAADAAIAGVLIGRDEINLVSDGVGLRTLPGSWRRSPRSPGTPRYPCARWRQ